MSASSDMKNIKDEFVVWVQLVPFVLIWVIVLYLTGSSLNINAEAIKKLPDVVTVYSIGFVVFTKWGWRWPIFRWLLRFPDLQGTWEGTLQTTWRDPANGQVPGPIPLILVIRQQFSSIACTMYTRESVSFSDAAILTEEDDSGLKQLSYNYTNTPRV